MHLKVVVYIVPVVIFWSVYSLELPSVPGRSQFSSTFWFTSKSVCSQLCCIESDYIPQPLKHYPFSYLLPYQWFYLVLSGLDSLWSIVRIRTIKCWTDILSSLNLIHYVQYTYVIDMFRKNSKYLSLKS